MCRSRRGRTWAVGSFVVFSFLLARESTAQLSIDSRLLREVSGRFEYRVVEAGEPLVVWYCQPPSVGPDTRSSFSCTAVTLRQLARHAISHTSTCGHTMYSFWLLSSPRIRIQATLTCLEVWPAQVASCCPSPSGVSELSNSSLTQREMGLSLRSTSYDIVGFSGGGQFVHRLVLFLPEARFRRAVAGSPGRYAFPTRATAFPYGLGNTSVDAAQLRHVFGRDFILVLGDKDTKDRDREPAATAPGKTRFARGLRFFRGGDQRSDRARRTAVVAATDSARSRP